MKEDHEFNEIIARSLREGKEQAEAEKELEATREAARKMQAAVVTDVLENVVLPLLGKAQAALHLAQIVSDIGNGLDVDGCLRRSLRIVGNFHSESPVIVFTAVTQLVPVPYLAWHTEPLRLGSPRPLTQIFDSSVGNISKIIGEFISQSIKPSHEKKTQY